MYFHIFFQLYVFSQNNNFTKNLLSNGPKLERLTDLDTPDLHGYNLEFPNWDYRSSLPKQNTKHSHSFSFCLS